MRWFAALLAGAGALLVAAFAGLGIPATGAGLAAKNVCSGVFVAGRPAADVLARDVLPASRLLHLAEVTVDAERQQVRGRMLWSGERIARLLPGLGCVLDPTLALVQAATGATGDRRPAAAPPSGADGIRAGIALPPTDWQGIDRRGLESVVDAAFQDAGDAAGRNTRAIVIVHRGRLAAERLAPGFDAATPQLGWSMSKTVLGLLVYMKLKEQGRTASVRAVDWVMPQRRPPWLQAWEGDVRGSMTVADLVYMRNRLAHRESYEPWSAVPRMLWGVDDAPAYAGSAAAEAPPGQRFRYLSATANILSRLLRAQFDSDGDYWRYPVDALFGPIGARSAVLESDPAGTFVASSYLWATPLDWARIGEVLRRDGLADNGRVFPAGWQAFAGQPPPSGDPAAKAYGAHVWLAGAGEGAACGPADTFLLSGHWSQLVAVVPSRESVIVRLGMTLDRRQFDGCDFIRTVLATLPPAPAGAAGEESRR